jgi:hypothetical protein
MNSGEKISGRQQFHERQDRPTGESEMTQDDIEFLKRSLALSYRCDVNDVKYHFERVYNEVTNEPETDYIYIKYTIQATRTIYAPPVGIVKTCEEMGKEIYEKEIFCRKIIVPRHIREKLRQTVGKKVETPQNEGNKDGGQFAFS